MRSLYYILDGDNVRAVLSATEWAMWYKKHDRQIAHDYIGNVRVSTVFLGLDHSFNFNGDAVPIVFETMIFGGIHDQYTNRYATKAEAIEGHKEALALAAIECVQDILPGCE